MVMLNVFEDLKIAQSIEVGGIESKTKSLPLVHFRLNHEP